MSVSKVTFVLYRPHDSHSVEWKQFCNAHYPESTLKQWPYSSGVFYKMVENPMGRPAPDDKTYFAFHFFQRPQPDSVKTEMDFVYSTEGFADVEMRDYTVLEEYDPRGLGNPTNPSSLILQAETIPADVEEFRDFYRVDHTVMMSKHPGYRRTTLYQLEFVRIPTSSRAKPAPILILHEFENFEGLGGPITQASVETPLAKKVFGSVKSMISRGLKLEST